MALTSTQISTFCRVAELTFIETGVCEGQTGYWLSQRDYTKIFVTEDAIYRKLDQRQNTLFETRRIPAETPATAD